MKIKLIWIVCLSATFVLLTCKKSDNSDIGIGKIAVINSGCKTHYIMYANPKDDCIKYIWSNNKLHIKHINAAFNCCPDTISADATIQDSIITIQEKELLTKRCKCNCLYDLEYDIPNVSQGKYYLRIKEPYISHDSNTFDFQIDLTNPDTAKYCIPRSQYPWGI
jgi:hypothetical protein